MTKDVATSAPHVEEMRVASEDYNELNAIAHRRFEHDFVAPALTWHRAFWIRDIYEWRHKNSPTPKSVRDYKAWHDRSLWEANPRKYVKITLDAAILSFYKAAQKAGYKPSIFSEYDYIYLFDAIIDKRTLANVRKHIFDNISDRVKDMMNADGRVISVKINMHAMPITVRVELRSEYFVITTFAEFSYNEYDKNYWSFIKFNKFTESFKVLNDCLLAPHADVVNPDYEKKCTLIDQYFHIGFWNEFLFDRAIAHVTRKAFSNHVFNNVFADFRGIILSNVAAGDPELADFSNVNDVKWGYYIDDKLRCILGSAKRYECTANYVMNGRGLYMSTLGPQDPREPDDKIIPIQFVVVVQQGDTDNLSIRGVNKHQLGRFIDRLHMLGTTRLAALKYFRHLREVGSALSQIDEYLQSARESVDSDMMSQEEEDNIDKVHRFFSRMTHVFNESTGTSSGILYRIERSRYYVSQFYKALPTLRITTLEGYTAYDKFVGRRLGPTFELIDRLGHRYQRARAAIAAIDQYYLSIQAKNITEKLAEIGEEAMWIQINGEFVLFLFLVPYYVSSLIFLIVKDNVADWLAVIVWILSVGYAVYGKLENAYEAEAGNDAEVTWRTHVKHGLTACVFPLAMLLVGAVMYAGGVLKVSEHSDAHHDGAETRINMGHADIGNISSADENIVVKEYLEKANMSMKITDVWPMQMSNASHGKSGSVRHHHGHTHKRD